jgi:hypothetical protein
MSRLWLVVLVAAGVLTACSRTSDGVPVAGETSRATTSVTAKPTEEADLTPPGVMPTTRTPIPADAVTCSQSGKPPVGMTATVPDPKAPRITVAVPDGWSMSGGSGDVGGRLAGPDGLTATVTISATTLDPAAAFTHYADAVMARSAVSSVSAMPADLCGYSGQKLMGAWSDSPQQAVEFTDRIVHIWTNSGNYLVAVHVQAPTDTKGFDAASAVLTEDFAIVLP